MAVNPPLATVQGFDYDSPVTQFPVRSGPGVSNIEQFKAQKGWANLSVLDVQPDQANTPNDADKTQVYQWFKLQFPNGQTGWLRAHILMLQGDFSAFGYGVLSVPVYAYKLRRGAPSAVAAPAPPPTPVTAPPAATTPAAAAPSTPAPAATTAPATTAQPVVQPAPSTPASPAVQPVVQQTPPAAAPAAPAPAAVPTTGPATIIVKTSTALNTRLGPSTNFDRSGVVLQPNDRLPLLEVQQEQAGQRYRWFKVMAQGRQVWVREDFVTYDGDTSAFGLPTDLYPAPMKTKYWLIRGFNMPPNLDPNPATYQHNGWDLGAATGEPVYCGPNGGTVVKVWDCTKCTPDRPSTVLNGISLGDPNVFTDPGWGNGYGTYVIVGYSSSQLPQSTQNWMAAKGFAGGSIFVMYAHLTTRSVQNNQQLAPGQQIGACGNTGNSEGPHVHLEVRPSKSPQWVGWPQLQSNVTDAVALFKR